MSTPGVTESESITAHRLSHGPLSCTYYCHQDDACFCISNYCVFCCTVFSQRPIISKLWDFFRVIIIIKEFPFVCYTMRVRKMIIIRHSRIYANYYNFTKLKYSHILNLKYAVIDCKHSSFQTSLLHMNRVIKFCNFVYK